eukprot:1873308-Amphidinium_carterae.1
MGMQEWSEYVVHRRDTLGMLLYTSCAVIVKNTMYGNTEPKTSKNILNYDYYHGTFATTCKNKCHKSRNDDG